MGIINTTPDSFSGDGIDYDIEKAIKLAKKLEQHGAHILDVGGESTRPTSIYSDVKKIPIEEELARTIPVIQALTQIINIPIPIPVSVTAQYDLKAKPIIPKATITVKVIYIAD